MNSFETQIDALLVPFIINTQGLHKHSLGVMSKLMNQVGNPHKKLRVIHIAGTSGKTSTAYSIAQQLHESGFRVGLFVSPHVYSITERVQIDMQQLSEQDFYDSLKQFIAQSTAQTIKPHFFELITAFGLWYFDKQNVDYLVVETGVGGLYDSTNIINNPDKVCVITQIGFDHMKLLGNTLPEIALQKAGIIHTGNEAFVVGQSKEVENTIQAYAKTKQVNCKFVNVPADMQLDFVSQNNYFATQVVKAIAKKDGFTVRATKKPVTAPGRLQQIYSDNSTIYADGAHNHQKVQALVSLLSQMYPAKKFTVLIALKSGKSYKPIIQELAKITEHLVVTEFQSSEILPVKSQPSDELANYAKSIGLSCVAEPDAQKASEIFKHHKNKHKLITGSFYLIGQTVKYF